MEQLNGTVNYGAIAYKDYGENFLTLSHDLSPDKNLIKNFVNKMESEGGGDEPEALAEALNKANRLTWREDAIKIIILISRY